MLSEKRKNSTNCGDTLKSPQNEEKSYWGPGPIYSFVSSPGRFLFVAWPKVKRASKHPSSPKTHFLERLKSIILADVFWCVRVFSGSRRNFHDYQAEDTLYVGSKTFWLAGGVRLVNSHNVTIHLDGTLEFLPGCVVDGNMWELSTLFRPVRGLHGTHGFSMCFLQLKAIFL